MQELVAPFTTVMTWLGLLLSSAAVVLLGLDAWHYQPHRRRALLGVGGMALVLVVTVVSLLLRAGHIPRGATWSQLLLLLVAPILVTSLYALTFPPLTPSRPALSQRRRLCLLLLTGLAGVCTAGLVLVDLFSS